MTKKKWAIGLLGIGILGAGAVYVAPIIQESNIGKSESIDVKSFEDMKELKIEIMDTSSFADKNLEKWFKTNQGVEGEHIYYDNTHTHILVTGKEKSEEIIWLDGVRTIGETLVVGYEFKDGADYGIKKDSGITPTLMIRTKGEFKKVSGVVVKQKQKEPKPPKITEEVNEGQSDSSQNEVKKVEEEVVKKEDEKEKEVEKEKEKVVEKEVEVKVEKDEDEKEKSSDK
jgi:hypothetical protein